MVCLRNICINTLHKGDDNDDDDDNNNNNIRMWKKKCMITPAIISATGIVTKGLKKNYDATPVKHAIYSLHKTAILGTSHIIRKVLQSEN